MTISEIIDSFETSSTSLKLFMFYIQCNMIKQPSKSWEETQTIIFDYNDERLKKWTTSNKNTFYKTIKELVDLHILFKGNKPKQYIVNPFYISCCSEKQMEDFHNDITNKFASLQKFPQGPPIV